MSKFYAVRVGRQPGIYNSWDIAKRQVDGFSGAQYKSFSDWMTARQYLDGSESIAVGAVGAVGAAPLSFGGNSGSGGGTSQPLVTIPSLPPPTYLGWHAWTDGSSRHGKGGFGVLIVVNSLPIRELSGSLALIPGEPTNQRAELYACIQAFYTCCGQTKELIIHTDSQYAIGCFQLWYPKWLTNNWNNNTVANRDLVEHGLQIMNNYSNIRFIHVMGHSGEPYNERVDQLAGQWTL